MTNSDGSALHSTHSSLTSDDSDGRSKISLRKFSEFYLLAIIVTGGSFSSADDPAGRGMVRGQREFRERFARPSPESAANSKHDLLMTAIESNRFTRDLKNVNNHKNSHKISEERRAEETRNSACEKLWQTEPDTEELLKIARRHSEWVEEYCAGAVVPGCIPGPIVLHLSRMCDSLPANIPDYNRLKTIVMRCPTIPCCDVSLSCKAKTSVEFNQTFKVTDAHSEDKRVVTIPLRNDTECECGKTTCPTKCPKPFRPTRERDKCDCTCHQKSKDAKRKCEEVMDGVQPLKDSEKRCVEENKCRLPFCAPNRRYDIRTGLCVSVCKT